MATACGSADSATAIEAAAPVLAVVDEPVDAPSSSPAPSDTSSTDIASTFPLTIVDHVGNTVTIDSVDRIVPLDGTVAEVVFALGLGDNVVATDLSATYPPEADALPEIGYQRALNAEPIAAFAPTLLLATDIAGPAEVLDDLRSLGYPLVIVPNESTASGPADKIRAVAEALGVPEQGEALASQVEAEIAAHTATNVADRPKVAALYVRGESTQLVLGRSAATHWLIDAAGGVDLADELDLDEASPVSAEALLRAAPDVLLVPARGLESVGGIDGLLALGGLGETPAGLNRAVVAFDDQLLLGNGPRTGELLADLSAALTQAGAS